MSELGGALSGSVDEAALAIENLYKGGQSDEADAGKDPETTDIAAQIEGNNPDAEETPEPTVEAQPEGTEPAAQPSKDETPPKAPELKPQPVIPATQAQPKAHDSTTAHAQLQQLNQLVPQLQARLAVSFPDIKTIEDLERLAVEDPARVIAYQVMERRVLAAQTDQQNLQQAARNEWLEGEKEALNRLIPDMADPKKAPELRNKLISYAKDSGFSEAQIDLASAAQVSLLHKAMRHDESERTAQVKAQAEAAAIVAAKKKAAEAPPVQKPGVAQVTDKKSEKDRELEGRFNKTGRIDDLAALLEHRG